jgi:cytosine/adenosine deaminase-related metal-dependent hydrolase
VAARLAGPAAGEADIVRAARTAAQTLSATGCVLVGDVSNSLATPGAIQAAGLAGVVFHELLGFNVSDPAEMVRAADRRVQRERETLSPDGPPLKVGITAHAPYSTSPGLMREIAELTQPTPLAIHLAESADELELLRRGSGAFRRLLEDFGVWDQAWQVPQCDPVEYLDDLGYLKPGLLAVHGVHLSDDALEVLREADAVIVTCPRSNEWVGGGIPRVAHFYAEDIPVAIGTDSLASCPSLNIFDELAELRRIAPDVAAASLLESATRVGAQALGFGAEYGTLSPGKQAAIIAVTVPPGTSDVEEYLVSGVPARAVRVLRP